MTTGGGLEERVKKLNVKEQLGYLTKGCVDVVPEDQLEEKLKKAEAEGKKLVVKVGHSILKSGCRVNVGKLLSNFHGGGHRVRHVRRDAPAPLEVRAAGHRDDVARLGVGQGQGWYYTKALPVTEFIGFIQRFNHG